MILQPYTSFTDETKAEQNTTMLNMIDVALARLKDEATATAPLPLAQFGRFDLNLQVSQGFPVSQTTPLPHGLGYAPIFMVYYFDAVLGEFAPTPTMQIHAGGPTSVVNSGPHLFAWSDSTNLNFVWEGGAQTPIQSLYYFIFKNPITS